MDDFKVEVVRIDKVEKHPNADRLDLAHVKGWQCVAQKDAFEAGDLAIYIPIDSVLPPDLERRIFPEGSKITLSKSRVKTIKIRGAISQGMLLSIFDASCLEGHGVSGHIVLGDDVTTMLGITKYEPPAAPSAMSGGQQQSKRKLNPFFKPYERLSHFKNFPELFLEGEDVVVSEKIHGTNFRAGWVPMQADSWWKKVKKLFGFLEEWEFVVGSHAVQLKPKAEWKGFYDTNVYMEAVQKYDLEARIPKGMVVYGEIYGDGIQKGYSYGVETPGEHKLVLFDVKVIVGQVAEYRSWAYLEELSHLLGVPTAPVIYKGPYSVVLRHKWEEGPSLLSKAQKHREGCVIKPAVEQECWIGRKVLRSINPEYLLVAESDFH